MASQAQSLTPPKLLRVLGPSSALQATAPKQLRERGRETEATFNNPGRWVHVIPRSSGCRVEFRSIESNAMGRPCVPGLCCHDSTWIEERQRAAIFTIWVVLVSLRAFKLAGLPTWQTRAAVPNNDDLFTHKSTWLVRGNGVNNRVAFARRPILLRRRFWQSVDVFHVPTPQH